MNTDILDWMLNASLTCEISSGKLTRFRFAIMGMKSLVDNQGDDCLHRVGGGRL